MTPPVLTVPEQRNRAQWAIQTVNDERGVQNFVAVTFCRATLMDEIVSRTYM